MLPAIQYYGLVQDEGSNSSQTLDDAPLGATTGFTIPEIVKSHGAIGSIINHSEHKIEHSQISNLVKRLRELDMNNCLADDLEEVEALSQFSSNYRP